MKTLIEYLEAIVDWNERHEIPVRKSLGKGLTASELEALIAASAFKFRVPDSVLSMYAWANGTQGCLFVPSYFLHDLETALRGGAYIQKIAKPDTASVRWLPILRAHNDDYGGSYYVQCSTDQSNDGPIYYWELQDEGSVPKLKFESVHSMFRTFALCMKKGAYRRTDDGFEERSRIVKEITCKCNPNIQTRRAQKRDDEA